ncbi:SDR family oxidoreductase [Tenacibaculum finnmarkense genomovar finnmarkense]|uniref:SDR family NAD(P)-dependent oxidoreductase n=1 Tax=Tenacibaculum finnmarkense TaxID=2781243 RepID=UPI001E2DD670|nr:SDR family oxidoreductase [Tenacibaculum finnmarkense]MCD8416503.1 SDR family oxidoreductase [Tenacibaculum finnmarkense genomovar finnmarkense]MCG8185296.1 SDR family oxidoreductase [Tenacibaculum finnmarkense genomovar finnmarkense]MCG8209202.1 SDR family oxidoreductase [Tenacibaculum finnmarkense genomovar finnmarkense]MCG8211997.1 SDR family oxidoreductase [Tenacibaculum finnmarkense genomovar finnmarkense]MCG8219070.1 SDR family oxidoreductase [Tenacibaculum finnmarkense genomovar finn
MKTIVVVGGSSGIGKAIVNKLKDTHKIINISRTAPEEHQNLTHYSCDVLNDELPVLEDINGLVYCPGSINLKSFTRLKVADFKTDFEINVVGAINTLKAYETSLAKNNGSVVLFSTVASALGMPFHASIATSKSAVEGLTKSLAAEYATKIRFNAIAPTVTDTPLAKRLLRNEKQQESMQDRHPLKKYLTPQEVAGLASYLLSDESGSITGQIIPMDAGIVSVKL